MTKNLNLSALTLGTGLSVCDDSTHVAWYQDEEGDVVGIGHGKELSLAILEAKADAEATLSLDPPGTFVELVADLQAITQEMTDWRKGLGK